MAGDKEDVDGRDGEDNRIIDLQTGVEQILIDPNGAGGHSDVGFGFMIAEDNFNPEPGAVRRWNLGIDMQGGQPALVRGQGELVYRTSSWSSGVGHIAYGNARSGVPIDQQVACASNASRQALPRVNEIVCFRLDGSLDHTGRRAESDRSECIRRWHRRLLRSCPKGTST